MFEAIMNVPGYLPMSDDTAEFDTAREAWLYLVEERERGEDDVDADDTGAVMALQAMSAADEPGTVYLGTPGYTGDHDLGIAYSVVEARVTEHDRECGCSNPYCQV